MWALRLAAEAREEKNWRISHLKIFIKNLSSEWKIRKIQLSQLNLKSINATLQNN